jgi:ATP-dependent Zn protease
LAELIIMVAVFLGAVTLYRDVNPPQTMPFIEFMSDVNGGKVSHATIDDRRVTFYIRNDGKEYVTAPPEDVGIANMTDGLRTKNVDTYVYPKSVVARAENIWSLWGQTLVEMLIVVFLIRVVRLARHQAQRR